MRALLTLACALPLLAQDPPPPQPAAPPPTDAKPAADSKPAESPVPSSESWFSGSIDLGYRWRTDVAGNSDAYRSLVNLGSGPKLLGTDFTITDPEHRLFDRINVRAYSWGDEPYETLHLDAKKSTLYNFSADYRDLAYFNFLPSYADPLLSRGVILNEQSFDTRRRFSSFRLDLLPGHWFVPYFAFDHDSGSGTGATTFVGDANQYPVPNTLSDLTNLYRGGVHFALRQFHVTLEQGGTTFRSDQSLFQPGGNNFGNVNTQIFGETTDLTSLLAAYGVRGSSVYSKALLTASPLPWIDFYGQFLFSQPSTSVRYQQSGTGNLFLQSQVAFYSGQQFLLSALAQMPHTTASVGAEIRPLPRLRIAQFWMTDRLHNAASANSGQTLQLPGFSEQMTSLLSSSLLNNYNQEEIQLTYDLSRKLILRGGYRYVWGDAADAILPPADLVSSDTEHLHRQVSLAGFTYRPLQKLSLTGESEVASSTGSYFRSSLYDYQKVRAQSRYQATGSLSFAADFLYMNNENPVPGVNYSYNARQESLSFLWAPKAGKLWDVEGSYARSTVLAQMFYLDPAFLTNAQSIYRDNDHTVTGIFTLNPSHANGLKISAGGSAFLSSGSRPTAYYQPYAKLLLPLNKHVAWFGEWTYYGYNEAFYLYEAFRAHLVTTGLRFSR